MDLRRRFGVLKAALIKWLGLLMSASLRRRTDGSAALTQQTANRLALFPTLTPPRQTSLVCATASWASPRTFAENSIGMSNWRPLVSVAAPVAATELMG